MQKKYFITGIGTDVGKTVVSAIVTEALQADYWKPIQAGDLSHSDTHKVSDLISNSKSVFHENAYALKTPMSPHAAAAIDGVTIKLSDIQIPETQNHLVIEGAGGLLVPINQHQTIADLIDPEYHVIVVSRHYLGSINHTLMTLALLAQKKCKVSVIFNGDQHPTTESIIKEMSQVHVIGRIAQEPKLNKDVIKKYAEQFQPKLV